MPTTLRQLFTIFALIGLLGYASISFIETMQRDNNANQTILDDPVINRTFTKLETNLSAYRTETQTQRANVESEIPERGFGTLIIFSIVSAGHVFTALTIGIYNILVVLPASILNVSDIVFSVLSAIIVVTLIIYLWSVIRVGR